jgi:hypothetical protein
VEEYGRTRQATDDGIIRRMRFACWITKATYTRGICGVQYFSAAIMVTLRRLELRFIRTLLPVLFLGDNVGSLKMAPVTCSRVRIGNLPDRSPACSGRVCKVPCSPSVCQSSSFSLSM